MDFEPLKLEHIKLLRPFFEKCSNRLCDCTVGGTFMWRDYFKTKFAIADNVLYLKVLDLEGRTAFAYPIGGDGDAPVNKILDYCRENSIVPEFCMVAKENLETLKKMMPEAEVYSERSWFDYLYNAEDMKSFAGRKYSGQRNHINKFLRLYENWNYEEITPQNADEVRQFMNLFIEADNGESRTLTEGNLKTVEILENFEVYGLLGGILRVDGKMVGMFIGETVGDTLFIHTEKCLREYEGAYNMLVRETARQFATDGIAFINREEDDGDEGLRTSKLSYHPCELLEKYAVR